jgi:hypothetical protein
VHLRCSIRSVMSMRRRQFAASGYIGSGMIGSVTVSQPEAAQQPEKTGRNKDGTFAKGVCPNPNGRPKGSLNKSTLAALAIMEADAVTIWQKAVELAKAGDLTAIRIVLDRLVAPGGTGPLRSRSRSSVPRRLCRRSLGDRDGNRRRQHNPQEAASLSAAVGGVAKPVETYELADRLAKQAGLRTQRAGRSAKRARRCDSSAAERALGTGEVEGSSPSRSTKEKLSAPRH